MNKVIKAKKYFILRVCFLVFSSLFYAIAAEAHTIPNSTVLISASDQQLLITLQLPLSELELAFEKPLQSEQRVVEKYGSGLQAYIRSHFNAGNGADSSVWPMEIMSLQADPVSIGSSADHLRQLSALVSVKIPDGVNPRKFYIYDDLIIHQVASHFAVVKVLQDFNTGTIVDAPVELGLIRLDDRNNIVPPFAVDLTPGGHWSGLKRFFVLGMDHILEGTDHLMFLFMLLLVTPLLVNAGVWNGFESTRSSIRKILKTVTAFTVGHSLTLLIVAFISKAQFVRPVEVLIAISIFISAVHVMKPLFPGREMVVAFSFGLIHGMAFGNSLATLQLDPSTRIMAVFSFNIGIEFMQVTVISVVIPVLLLLRGPNYRTVRVAGGMVGCIASLSWMLERISGQSNPVSQWLSNIHF